MDTDARARRVYGLDLVKLLGLFLVIYYHIEWQYSPDILTSKNPGNYIVVFLQTFLAICVPLFFMASGALTLSRPVDLRKNTLRFLHMVLLTAFWAVCCLGVVLALKGERVSLREFLSLASQLKIGYIQHLWYLPCFLFLTLMSPILCALKEGNRRVYRYFIGLIALFSFGNPLLNNLEYILRMLLGKTGYSGWRYFFWKVDFFQYHYWYMFVYFALGGYLMEHHSIKRKHLLPIGIFAGMAGLFLIALADCRVRGEAYDYVFNNYSSVFTLLIAGCVFVLLLNAEAPRWLKSVAASVAKCSLGIYITHWLVWGAFVRLLPDIMKNMVYAIPMTFVIGGISWGITALGLRIPLVKNLFTAAPDWIRKIKK